MLKPFFTPNKNNRALWLNALFLLVLLFTNNADPIAIVLAYFLETIIIGILHVVKLFLVIKHGKKDEKATSLESGYGLILFFIFHYGFFVGVQLILFFSFISKEISNIPDLFSLESGILYVLVSIGVTNISYFYNNFLVPKKYLDYTPKSIFFKPYVRIIIQQFVVILSAFSLVVFPGGMVPAILIIVFRLLVDSIMVSFKKDSKSFDSFVKSKSSSYEHYEEMKRKYQEFSE